MGEIFFFHSPFTKKRSVNFWGEEEDEEEGRALRVRAWRVGEGYFFVIGAAPSQKKKTKQKRQTILYFFLKPEMRSSQAATTASMITGSIWNDDSSAWCCHFVLSCRFFLVECVEEKKKYLAMDRTGAKPSSTFFCSLKFLFFFMFLLLIITKPTLIGFFPWEGKPHIYTHHPPWNNIITTTTTQREKKRYLLLVCVCVRVLT